MAASIFEVHTAERAFVNLFEVRTTKTALVNLFEVQYRQNSTR